MRECGNCTLCCTLVGVHALDKPMGQHCPHCNVNKNCKIYDTRPSECKDFDCAWLLGQVPESLKPEKTHIVLSDLQIDLQKIDVEIDEHVVLVYTDPEYPDAYKQGEMVDYLNALLAQGTALIVLKDGQKIYMKYGKVDSDIKPTAVPQNNWYNYKEL